MQKYYVYIWFLVDSNEVFYVGKKQSEITIEKRRIKMRGRRISDNTKEKIGKANGRPVAMIDPKTHEILKTYYSASEAARCNGLNNSKISRVCNGDRKTTGGFRWEYLDKAIPS